MILCFVDGEFSNPFCINRSITLNDNGKNDFSGILIYKLRLFEKVKFSNEKKNYD